MRKQAVNVTEEERVEETGRNDILYTRSKKKNESGGQFRTWSRLQAGILPIAIGSVIPRHFMIG
jgi:hypothetical protein